MRKNKYYKRTTFITFKLGTSVKTGIDNKAISFSGASDVGFSKSEEYSWRFCGNMIFTSAWCKSGKKSFGTSKTGK